MTSVFCAPCISKHAFLPIPCTLCTCIQLGDHSTLVCHHAASLYICCSSLSLCTCIYSRGRKSGYVIYSNMAIVYVYALHVLRTFICTCVHVCVCACMHVYSLYSLSSPSGCCVACAHSVLFESVNMPPHPMHSMHMLTARCPQYTHHLLVAPSLLVVRVRGDEQQFPITS